MENLLDKCWMPGICQTLSSPVLVPLLAVTVEYEDWQPHVTVPVLLVQAEAVVGVGHLAHPHYEVFPQARHH